MTNAKLRQFGHYIGFNEKKQVWLYKINEQLYIWSSKGIKRLEQ